MSRFDAATAADRQVLFADAIAAHRERSSPFCTIEADPESLPEESELGIPWVQFGDGIVNLDCTEEELDRLKSLLQDFPACTVDELTRPDDADGVNVRVSATVDPHRVAQLVDAIFVRVYELPESYRGWVVEL